jgi:hypothetical protein
MRDTATLTLSEPHRLARAFLALTDDVAAEPAGRSPAAAAAAFAAAIVLAVSAPMTWLAPAPPSVPSKVGDQPAATLANSKAALAAADDEDADGGD